jgi:hypothetical protein
MSGGITPLVLRVLLALAGTILTSSIFYIVNLDSLFESGKCVSISVIKAKSITHASSVITVSKRNET